jgi:hypothetical protein
MAYAFVPSDSRVELQKHPAFRRLVKVSRKRQGDSPGEKAFRSAARKEPEQNMENARTGLSVTQNVYAGASYAVGMNFLCEMCPLTVKLRK